MTAAATPVVAAPAEPTGSIASTAPAGPRTAHDLVARLVELTPLPPDGAEVEHLLAVFEAVVANRDAILALIVPPLRLADADRSLLAELEHRHAAWQDALASAQRSVAAQRSGAEHLRAYAERL
jgi:hypothetical protein